MASVILFVDLMANFLSWLACSVVMFFYMAFVGFGYLLICLKDSITMGFLEAVIGSGFGAYAGAAAVWKLEQIKETKENLSAVNSNLIILSNILGKLISIKKTIVPIYNETASHKEILSNGGGISIKLGLQKIIVPKMPSLEKVFDFVCAHSSGNSKPVSLCDKIITNIDELNDILASRNVLIQKLADDPTDHQIKLPKAFGMRTPTGEVDNNLQDLTKAVSDKVDACLFYCFYGFKELRVLGIHVLPKRFNKNIIDSKVLAEDVGLIPGYDFIPGYYDKDPSFI